MDVVPWLVALGLLLLGVPILGSLIAIGLAFSLRLALEGYGEEVSAEEGG